MSEYGFLAHLALFAYVPVCIAGFFAWRPHVAATLGIFGGALFLPELVNIDLPGLPPFDKKGAISLGVFIGAFIKSPRRMRLFLGYGGVGLFLIGAMLAGVGTALLNEDELWYGPTRIPALTANDAISFAVRDTIYLAVPFLVGRALFHRREHLEDLLRIVVKLGLVYSLFILVEIRMSPQFHNWVYGYGQHDFRQVIRWGGYRPMVFMEHGLAVGMFMATVVISCAALAKTKRPVSQIPARFLLFYLLFILVIVKSLGALVYGFLGTVAIYLFKGRSQLKLASVLAFAVLTYPLLQAADLFPREQILDALYATLPERAESLQFRLDNEERLLDKLRERPWFGWGEFGRNHIYDPHDGYNMSVTDGYWIILLGVRGILGFIPIFLLLLLPVASAARKDRRLRDPVTQGLLAGVALLHVLQVLDLLPNGLFTQFPFFFAGLLLSLQRALVAEEVVLPLGQGPVPDEDPEPDEFIYAPPDDPTSLGDQDPFDPTWQPNPAPGMQR